MSKASRFVAALIILLMIAAAVAFMVAHMGHGPAAPAAKPTSTEPQPSPASTVSDAQQIDAIRRGVPLDREGAPPAMARVENTDIKRNRAYPMQPPTIPHTIDGYQIDRNSNRCMLCHARANADKFQAPPVSVTHYMDRDDQFLATISPRRYFCNQCHVVQTDAKPLVANNFKDIDTIMSEAQQQQQKAN